MADTVIDRGERRYRTEKIALKRSRLYPSDWDIVGRFRKWNLTCRCSMCKCSKAAEIALQRMKDSRRNLMEAA